jgi:hypothetical protein
LLVVGHPRLRMIAFHLVGEVFVRVAKDHLCAVSVPDLYLHFTSTIFGGQ